MDQTGQVAHSYDLYKIFAAFILASSIFLPSTGVAQTGSVDPRAETPPPTIPDAGAAPATTATSTPSSPAVQGSAPATPSAPRATPAAPVEGLSAEAPAVEASAVPAETASSSLLLLAVVGMLAILPFGYLVAQALKKKNPKKEEEDPGCFNLKKLLEDKLKELTDIKGQIEGKVIDKAKEGVRESVKGTSAGELLAAAEKAEKEYGRLKKLLEECTISFEKNAFRGTIVESSLRSKTILEKVNIKHTHHTESWTLHDVFIDEKKIAELSEHLADGPWYAHFWKQDNDDMRIVFKDKVFAVKLSDKSTWTDAIAHGKSLGIPEEQLDFKRE